MLQLTRPPCNDEELHALVEHMWGVRIPNTVHPECVDKGHCAPMDWFAAVFFKRAKRAFSMGSRGLSGKTYAMAALGLTMATVLGASVTIAAGSTPQTEASLEHMKAMWEHPTAPRHLLSRITADKQYLTNGAVIQSVTSSERGLRSKHNAVLLIDEIDEWGEGNGPKGFTLLESAQGMPMTQPNWFDMKVGPYVAGTSTLQRVDGPFQRYIDLLEDRDEKLWVWCYRESLEENGGWLTWEQVEHKKETLSHDRFEREYELNKPAADNLAIDPNAVESTFSMPAPGLYDQVIKPTKEKEEYFFESYNYSDDYVIAADWARVKDFTVISVWKTTGFPHVPMSLVYYYRARHESWPDQVDKFNKLQEQYNAEGIHDATGVGDVVAGFVASPSRVWNFKMAGEKRTNMLNDAINGIEKGRMRSPRIKSLYEATRYVTYDDLFRVGDKYHLPDEFCSLALAYQTQAYKAVGAAPIGFPRTEAKFDIERPRLYEPGTKKEPSESNEEAWEYDLALTADSWLDSGYNRLY